MEVNTASDEVLRENKMRAWRELVHGMQAECGLLEAWLRFWYHMVLQAPLGVTPVLPCVGNLYLYRVILSVTGCSPKTKIKKNVSGDGTSTGRMTAENRHRSS